MTAPDRRRRDGAAPGSRTRLVAPPIYTVVLDKKVRGRKTNSPFSVDRASAEVPRLATRDDDAEDHDDVPAHQRIEQKSP